MAAVNESPFDLIVVAVVVDGGHFGGDFIASSFAHLVDSAGEILHHITAEDCLMEGKVRLVGYHHRYSPE